MQHSMMLHTCNSIVLHHLRSSLLCNSRMKLIGQIRRERLQMLRAETGMSFADINAKLGRSRRDATLSQIANEAPNTSTGKPRQMGDDQARELEVAFDKEKGWFDRDPDFDALQAQYSSLKASEPPATYNIWPFQRITRERFYKLPDVERERLEAMVESQVQFVENQSQPPSTGSAAA